MNLYENDLLGKCSLGNPQKEWVKQSRAGQQAKWRFNFSQLAMRVASVCCGKTQAGTESGLSHSHTVFPLPTALGDTLGFL